jgi:hypothetical protein
MRPKVYQLISSLSVVTTLILILSACEGQPTTVSATQPITNAIPTGSPIPTTVHALPTPAPPKLADSASMHIAKVIPMYPEFTFGLAFARQSLWVLRRRSSFLPPGLIERIDPVTGQIAGEPIQVEFDPWSFAVTEDAIWVAKNGPQKVIRIDPVTQKVVANLDIPAGLVVATANGLWASGLWVVETDPYANTVLHIDPVNNQVVGDPITVGIEPIQMVAGAGAIWVGAHSGPPAVTRIDPKTGNNGDN